ncbi:hypothetical protein Hanom_Chr16g01480901 [Helianthus anomalus]
MSRKSNQKPNIRFGFGSNQSMKKKPKFQFSNFEFCLLRFTNSLGLIMYSRRNL